MYECLTKHISNLQEGSFGEWVIDTQNDGTAEHPFQMPFVNYSEDVDSFGKYFHQFMSDYSDINFRDYQKILEENGIEWDFNSMNDADVSSLGELCVLALLMGVIRADRFCEGAFLHFLESGAVERWLLRLKEIDETL